MRAEAQGSRVAVYMQWNDPEEYLPALNEIIEAQAEVDAHRNDYPSSVLAPMLGRVAAAEVDLDELFCESISIEHAQHLHNQLYKALIAAKVNRGDFNGADE